MSQYVPAAATSAELATHVKFASLHTFSNYSSQSQGAQPEANLVVRDGVLYGTTYSRSTVFKITTAGKLTTLYTFNGVMDGTAPTAPLVLKSGVFYGTTSMGGASGLGAVFRMSPSGIGSIVHPFHGTGDGQTQSGAWSR